MMAVSINYITLAAISAQLGATVNPFFDIRRTSPSTATLLVGNMSILNVNILLVLTLRVILGNGQITILGGLDLTAGDVIGLYYNADGLTVPIGFGNENGSGIIWTIHDL